MVTVIILNFTTIIIINNVVIFYYRYIGLGEAGPVLWGSESSNSGPLGLGG